MAMHRLQDFSAVIIQDKPASRVAVKYARLFVVQLNYLAEKDVQLLRAFQIISGDVAARIPPNIAISMRRYYHSNND